MDYNSIINNLNTAFQNIVLEGATENNLELITSTLLDVVDTTDLAIFNSPLLNNLIYFLEINHISTILISQLISEIKLKSLRLIYTNKNKILLNDEANTIEVKNNASNADDELPRFTSLPSLPEVGSYGRAKMVSYKDGKEQIKTYRIDHTGQAIELLEIEEHPHHDFSQLNDNVIDRVLSEMDNPNSKRCKAPEVRKTKPLTEEDL